MDESADELSKVDKINQAVDDAFLAMINQQSGLRGYLLTQEDRFLAPYKQGTTDFAKAVSDARQFIDNPEQHRLVENLDALGGQWHALAENAIQLMPDPGKREEARQIVINGADKATMDKFRAAAKALAETEDGVTTALQSEADAAADSAELFAIGGGVLVVLVSTLAGFLLYSDVGAPIIAMTAAMRRLADGGLSSRSRAPAGPMKSAPWPTQSACSHIERSDPRSVGVAKHRKGRRRPLILGR
jgi:methyl-accepting chemotaxis protein